ncbi:MAG: monovalent cation/H(+) antiporter subunit G [Halobacteriales archaeon]
MRDVAVVLLAAGGVFFVAVGALGLVRLPDVYSRAHAAGKAETLGAGLSLAAVALAFGEPDHALKTGMLLVFLYLTGPTAAHAITRAAYRSGVEPWTSDEGGERK